MGLWWAASGASWVHAGVGFGIWEGEEGAAA